MILDLYANEIFDKGIYKFYVNLDNFNKIKDKLDLKDLDNNLVETFSYNNNIFYCVYVGKTENSFLKRVINAHIGGTSKNSILRKKLIRIFGMKEDELSRFLINRSECLFCIFSVHGNETIPDLEKKAINKYVHILNLDKNEFYKKDEFSKNKKILRGL